jgi:hypothetical protein
MTEWNGFKVLDGTAGERVGEVPVYKATSVNLSGDVLINPTTLRTVAGPDAGEQQTITFSGTPHPGVGRIIVAGVEIAIDGTKVETAEDFASAVAAGLTSSSSFNASSGRSAVAEGDRVILTFSAADQDPDNIKLLDSGTGMVASATVSATRTAVYGTSEKLSGGAFIKSGSLSISLSAATESVRAVFTTVDGTDITMTGVVDREAGTVSFTRGAGNNRQVFSGELTDTLVFGFRN